MRKQFSYLIIALLFLLDATANALHTDRGLSETTDKFFERALADISVKFRALMQASFFNKELVPAEMNRSENKDSHNKNDGSRKKNKNKKSNSNHGQEEEMNSSNDDRYDGWFDKPRKEVSEENHPTETRYGSYGYSRCDETSAPVVNENMCNGEWMETKPKGKNNEKVQKGSTKDEKKHHGDKGKNRVVMQTKEKTQRVIFWVGSERSVIKMSTVQKCDMEEDGYHFSKSVKVGVKKTRKYRRSGNWGRRYDKFYE